MRYKLYVWDEMLEMLLQKLSERGYVPLPYQRQGPAVVLVFETALDADLHKYAHEGLRNGSIHSYEVAIRRQGI